MRYLDYGNKHKRREKMEYYNKAKKAVKSLETKVNKLFSPQSDKSPTEAWLTFVDSRESLLDKHNSFRYVETLEGKEELNSAITELTKKAESFKEMMSDCRQYAFSMAELRLRKEAQYETNNKNWQPI